VSEPVKVRLIVGVYRADLSDDHIPLPLVAGCIDQSTWEIVDAEETDAWARDLRQRYDPGDGDYEWREVVAEFDADALRSVFQTTKIRGELT
jgi:hypothetical protein